MTEKQLREAQEKLIEQQQKLIDKLIEQLLLGNKPTTIPYPVSYLVYPLPTPYPYPGPFVYDSNTHSTAVDNWQGTRYYDETGKMVQL